MFRKIFPLQIHQNFSRNFATKAKKINPLKKFTPRVENGAEFLANKGFLRPQKSYTPPDDVPAKISQICAQILGSNTELNSKKFEFLTACEKEFNYSIPNSLLHTMKDVKNVLEFYSTPKNAIIPLEMMKNINLPENVHIQYEYHRFHPETDALFNGITAFPRSSTLVTGLKYKEKYAGFKATQKWPYNT